MVFAISFSLKQLIKSTRRLIWISFLAESKQSSAVLETFFYFFSLFFYSFVDFLQIIIFIDSAFNLFFFLFPIMIFSLHRFKFCSFSLGFIGWVKEKKKANLNAVDIIISNGSYLARDIINQFRCLSECIIKFFLSFGHFFPSSFSYSGFSRYEDIDWRFNSSFVSY